MIHHAVWSEGLPDEAHHTTSWWSAHWFKLKRQIHHMLHVRTARRMRHATSEEGAPDPRSVERRLQEIGAIPPPGGWPKPAAEAPVDARPDIDVHVVTHSVV